MPVHQTLGKEASFAEFLLELSAQGLAVGPTGPVFAEGLTLGKGSVTVTWRRDGDFSLPSAKWHSAKTLPSARQKVLGKEAVADVQFAERSLPSVTLGKAVAECKIAFAVCLEHTAKKLIPVVYAPSMTFDIAFVMVRKKRERSRRGLNLMH